MVFCPLAPDSWFRIFFADPDPGSQNVADPTDPDHKHAIGRVQKKNLFYSIVLDISNLDKSLDK